MLLKTGEDHARLFPFHSLLDRSVPDWRGGWSAETIAIQTKDFFAVYRELTDFIVRLRAELDMWPTDWRPNP